MKSNEFNQCCIANANQFQVC